MYTVLKTPNFSREYCAMNGNLMELLSVTGRGVGFVSLKYAKKSVAGLGLMVSINPSMPA